MDGLPTVGTVAVVTSVVHYDHDGRVFAHAPYARELEIWAALFNELRVVAPVRVGPPPDDASQVETRNLDLRPFPATGGEDLAAKVLQAVRVPEMMVRLGRALGGVDAIHVRCPSNVGLLALLIAPLRSARLHAKYAQLWGPYPGEPLANRVQRFLLRSSWWRGQADVYGRQSKDPDRIRSAFGAALSQAQLDSMGDEARSTRDGPLRLAFVGRLTEFKNVDTVVRATALYAGRGESVELRIVGDGPARAELRRLASEIGLSAQITFTGSLPASEVIQTYRWADAVALPSEAEGWPKALVEAMAFGAIGIGADRGLTPRLLENRGVTVPVGDAAALADALQSLQRAPERAAQLRTEGTRWARQFSTDAFAARLQAELRTAWAGPFRRRWIPLKGRS